MFEPECQNIDCPECLRGKLYFDREIGYYCMLCGHEFSTDDMEMLIEKIELTSRSGQQPVQSPKTPIVEIKELHSHKGKHKHIKRDVIGHKNTEQQAPDS